MTDPVGEAIDLFEHMLDKTALVWFQTNRSKFKDLTTLKMMFLQRYNPWGKTKREQLQSWNILSFNPKTTDVDEHINLINTLGDMIDQKEEAKKEKFIETMPTMIQTHLITCKDWATVKDTVKSLEHTIMKCDPPTLAMPMITKGATVPGLYSHIAHLVKYPNHLKVQNQNKPEVEENLKENLKNKDRTYQKPKRQMKPIHTKTLIITITMPQVRIEAADPTMVRVEIKNFEGSHNKIEAKDLSIVNVSFKIIIIREAHHNKIIPNTAMVLNPISRGIMLILIEAEAVAMDLNNSEDAVMVGPTIRITIEHISTSITHMTHNQNNTVLPAVYVVDSTIPLSTGTRVNMI